MMKLRISPLVAVDLKNIKEYIAEDSEEMAVKTIQEIYTQIENIQQFKIIANRAYKMFIKGDFKVLSGDDDEDIKNVEGVETVDELGVNNRSLNE